MISVVLELSGIPRSRRGGSLFADLILNASVCWRTGALAGDPPDTAHLRRPKSGEAQLAAESDKAGRACWRAATSRAEQLRAS